MERKDHKSTRIDHWVSCHAPRSEYTDTSTTELRGTRREADLIVRGLNTLLGQVTIRDAAGMKSAGENQFKHGSLGSPPQIAEVQRLISEISQPVYEGEPEVVHHQV